MDSRGLVLLMLGAGCAADLGVPPSSRPLRSERHVIPEWDEASCASASSSWSPPAGLLDTSDGGCDPATEAYCFHLRPQLRLVAAAADPLRALSAAAEAIDRGRQETPAPFGLALADLAVTGARAYEAFAAMRPTVADIPGPASPAAKSLALSRAYDVAWALRGPPSTRTWLRPRLGYVAVSPEDDPPARPVNISTSFVQTDLMVEVEPRAVRTRVILASTLAAPPTPPRTDGSLPTEPPLRLPEEGPVLLFLHGHASLAEEGAALLPAIVERARDRGETVTVVAFDQPSNAYSDHIDPSELDGSDEAALEFLERFVLAFVETLEARQPGVKERLTGVLGGSLGGNLVLRLSQRADTPWLRRAVAWSPASVDVSWARAGWIPGHGDYVDVLKHEAVRMTRDASRAEEEEDSRKDYFKHPFLGVTTQADYWYREGWDVCKPALVHEGMRQLSEVYDAAFRRWHYRLAFEQLVFSHIDEDPETGRRPFESLAVPLLLVVGDGDDRSPMKTYSFVERLAPYLTVPGETLFLADTGHAMHSERPQLLAREISQFLAAPMPAVRVTE